MSGIAQLLQNAVYGTALILAAAALRRALKGRLAPEARLALWAVCLFRLLTPAAPGSVLSLWGLFTKPTPVPNLPPEFLPAISEPVIPSPALFDPVVSSPAVPAPAPAAGAPQLYAPAQAGPSPASPSIPWGTVLLAVWLAVGIALAVWYALGWRRTRRAVACTVPVERGDPRYIPLPKCARLREGPMEGAPLTFGAVKPTVVLPPGLEGGALDCVLAHEGVHASRRDNLWHYVMAAALIVHWWNPAVWLMSRLLRRDIELSCDRAALKKLGVEKRAEYAKTLVFLSTQGGGSAFSHAFGRKLTEERIVMIMKYKKMTALGLALSLLLVCGVTVAFATEPVEPAGEPLDGISEPVSTITKEELIEQLKEKVAPRAQAIWTKELQRAFEKSAGTVEEPVLRSSCKHPNISDYGRFISYIPVDASKHSITVIFGRVCYDCLTVFDGQVVSETEESHTFGVGSYVSSNHSAANPKLHFATYKHMCSVCNGTYTYTSLTGCTQYGCVDIHSVTPEPAVDDPAPSAAPVEYSSDNADLKDMLEEQWKAQIEHQMEERLTQLHTAPVTPSDHQ